MTNPSPRKRIAVVTSTRADFSLLQPVADTLAARPEFDVGWIASAAHFVRELGDTIGEVRKSRLPIWDEVHFLLADDSEDALVLAAGLAVAGYGQALGRVSPDLVLLLGDRWEIQNCATAATLRRIPIAHIHGGEESSGAIDNVLRHSITKLAHLHLAATKLSALRIRRMGEAPDRVFVTGSPAVDKLNAVRYVDRATFAETWGAPAEPFLLITYHPQTTDPAATERGLASLLSVVKARALPTLFTFANADSYGRTINTAISEFCAANDFARVTPSLGGEGYANAMKHALAMLGNSSSGIIEAAHFGLPVVNIGERQSGRERSGNTIETDEAEENVSAALDRALSAEFRQHCRQVVNVYGDGRAAERAVAAISGYCAGTMSIAKSFSLEAGELN
jgi:UDP-hydrolysing UDP-N-acetyl-D-glucosamine 2-epimerase